MKFHLTIHIIKGKFAGKWMSMNFGVDTREKAFEFSKEIQQLRQWNTEEVEFGGYTLQRKFGPFLWLTLLSVAEDGKVLFDRCNQTDKKEEQ
jgi:hypothetical protein